MDDQLKKDLRQAYDGSAHLRETYIQASWKIAERDDFLERLIAENRTSLLEIGAGVGRDSKFFLDNGLQVTCIDLSPKMVAFCLEKGLEAYEMDFMNLDFPAGHFDALYTINSLLHVPPEDLSQVLGEIRRPLKTSGLFFLGVYGGINQAEIWEGDDHDPQRYYAFHTDDDLLKIVSQYFSVVDFKRINLDHLDESGLHFQRLILRKI